MENVSKIKCSDKFGSTSINFYKYGTMGWLRKNDEVRQCRFEGATWKKNDEGYLCPIYKLNVAGIGIIDVEGRKTGSIDEVVFNGKIYETQIAAQTCGSGLKDKGILKLNGEFHLANALIEKYHLGKECFDFGGTLNNILHISTYSLYTDNSVRLTETDFTIVLTEDGIHVAIPKIESGCRWASMEEGISHTRKLPTYTFGDENKVAIIETEEIEITIKIKKTNITKLESIGAVLL